MANIKTKKGVIGILTGGGDVPGLNPAIRAVTIRALREGYQVIGIRHGWAGLVDLIPDAQADNSAATRTVPARHVKTNRAPDRARPALYPRCIAILTRKLERAHRAVSGLLAA